MQSVVLKLRTGSQQSLGTDISQLSGDFDAKRLCILRRVCCRSFQTIDSVET